jgi:hypothetical protein
VLIFNYVPFLFHGGGEGSGAAAGVSRWWIGTELRGLVPGFVFRKVSGEDGA